MLLMANRRDMIPDRATIINHADLASDLESPRRKFAVLRVRLAAANSAQTLDFRLGHVTE